MGNITLQFIIPYKLDSSNWILQTGFFKLDSLNSIPQTRFLKLDSSNSIPQTRFSRFSSKTGLFAFCIHWNLYSSHLIRNNVYVSFISLFELHKNMQQKNKNNEKKIKMKTSSFRLNHHPKHKMKKM